MKNHHHHHHPGLGGINSFRSVGRRLNSRSTTYSPLLSIILLSPVILDEMQILYTPQQILYVLGFSIGRVSRPLPFPPRPLVAIPKVHIG